MECYHAMISVPTVLAEMNHLMTTQGHHPCVIDEVRAEIMPVILAGCGGSLLQSLSLSHQQKASQFEFLPNRCRPIISMTSWPGKP